MIATLALSPAAGSAEETADVGIFWLTQIPGDRVDGPAKAPAVNHDGTVFAFSSAASNLVSDDVDDNGRFDIFVHEPATGTTVRVTKAVDGSDSDEDSTRPSLSDSARLVVFESDASNLVTDDPNGFTRDVFLHDRATDETTLLTPGGSATSTRARITGPGEYVVFQSWANNLVPDDKNRSSDIFVVDIDTGGLERVSVGTDGAEANGGSTNPSITDDGRLVAFYSAATNLVDDGGGAGYFVRDRSTGATMRVSVNSFGQPLTGELFVLNGIEISGDGSTVAFTYGGSDIDGTATIGVFAPDLAAGSTERVSETDDDTAADRRSVNPSVSDDGSRIAFKSSLAFGRASISYVRDRREGTTATPLRSEKTGQVGGQTSNRPIISGDGSTLTFTSPFDIDSEITFFARGFTPDEVFGARLGTLAPDDLCDGVPVTIRGSGTIEGSAAADVIAGSEGPDTIEGGLGPDLICGRGDDDTISGGPGDDSILGEAGADDLIGNGGSDRIKGGPGPDVIEGRDGPDRLLGGSDDDEIKGGEGDDLLEGDAGTDVLRGGNGDDTISGGLGADLVFGGPDARDRVSYRGHPCGVRVVLDDKANDGCPGEGDRIDPSIEDVVGSDFDDVVIGSDANNNFAGSAGADRLVGRGGDDRLDGGDGPDLLNGGTGRNTLEGGFGDDSLVGGPENDRLIGEGGGGDFCNGNGGDDFLRGCEILPTP